MKYPALILALILAFTHLSAHAQTKSVLKNIATNALTESLTVPSAQTLTIAAGATITAPAYRLSASDDDTLSDGQSGLGTRDNRTTLQFENGSLQMFQTGSPAESVLYWAGRFQVGSLEAASITGDLDASLITSGLLSATILNNSMPRPFDAFVNSATGAGANGLTYGTTGPNSSMEPSTPGTYFPQILVIDGGENVNYLQGRNRTASQFRTDLGLGTLATITPTGTASSTTYLRGDGSWQTISAGASPGGSSGDVQYNNAGSLGGVAGMTTSSGVLQRIMVPTSANFNISHARTNGIIFGSNAATAQIGINGFNSTLYFHTSSSTDSSIVPMLININELGLSSGIAVGWSANNASGSKDIAVQRAAAGILLFRGTSTTVGAALRMVERTTPASAPPTDAAEIWLEDNGSGKTRLMIRFASGAAQQITIEP